MRRSPGVLGLGSQKRDYSAGCLLRRPLQLLFGIENSEQGGRDRPCRSDSHKGADTVTRMLLPKNMWALGISGSPALPAASQHATAYSVWVPPTWSQHQTPTVGLGFSRLSPVQMPITSLNSCRLGFPQVSYQGSAVFQGGLQNSGKHSI